MPLRVTAGLVAAQPPAPIVSGLQKLPIAPVLQSGKNWCWAACAEMVVGHVRMAAASQCAIADSYVGGGCCGSNPPTPACDQPCPASQISAVYQNWSVASRARQAQVPFSAVQREIAQWRPVQISFQYGNGTGHAIVVSGWTTGVMGNTVDVLDPGHAHISALYVDLQTAFGTGGVWDWTWTDLS
jgi:hypothetical protein